MESLLLTFKLHSVAQNYFIIIFIYKCVQAVFCDTHCGLWYFLFALIILKINLKIDEDPPVVILSDWT